jgi:hypothetical protein
MLENDKIIDSAEESFFDMDRILGLTDDEFHGDMELFMTYGLEKGFLFLRATDKNTQHMHWNTMLQDCIAQSDNLACFAWNMDTGKDHTDVLDGVERYRCCHCN